MDEVGGDAAIYIDPENPKSSAIALKYVLARASSKRESSLRNAARFSESFTIDGYLSVYERVQREAYASRGKLVPSVS
jgi:hypothetical protein